MQNKMGFSEGRLVFQTPGPTPGPNVPGALPVAPNAPVAAPSAAPAAAPEVPKSKMTARELVGMKANLKIEQLKGMINDGVNNKFKSFTDVVAFRGDTKAVLTGNLEVGSEVFKKGLMSQVDGLFQQGSIDLATRKINEFFPGSEVQPKDISDFLVAVCTNSVIFEVQKCLKDNGYERLSQFYDKFSKTDVIPMTVNFGDEMTPTVAIDKTDVRFKPFDDRYEAFKKAYPETPAGQAAAPTDAQLDANQKKVCQDLRGNFFGQILLGSGLVKQCKLGSKEATEHEPPITTKPQLDEYNLGKFAEVLTGQNWLASFVTWLGGGVALLPADVAKGFGEMAGMFGGRLQALVPKAQDLLKPFGLAEFAKKEAPNLADGSKPDSIDTKEKFTALFAKTDSVEKHAKGVTLASEAKLEGNKKIRVTLAKGATMDLPQGVQSVSTPNGPLDVKKDTAGKQVAFTEQQITVVGAIPAGTTFKGAVTFEELPA